MLAGKPRSAPASPNAFIRIRYGTVSPPTLLEAGADLPTIQKLLGHADIRDTTIYLHLSRKHLKTVANPLDEIPITSSTELRGKVKRARK